MCSHGNVVLRVRLLGRNPGLIIRRIILANMDVILANFSELNKLYRRAM
jgi:hypothetical protein